MTHPSTLDTLIELAHKETDAAAKRLGDALRAIDDAKQKLDMLITYREEYALRCQTTLANGVSTARFNNFQMFMHKLDGAIKGQQEVLRGVERHAEQARNSWLGCEQKKMSFVTLANRASKEETRRELRRDQKLNDEYAARQAPRRQSLTRNGSKP